MSCNGNLRDKFQNTYTYRLPESMGGLMTADRVGKEGYTVMSVDKGIVTRTKLPGQEAVRADRLVQQGDFAGALKILSPLFS